MLRRNRVVWLGLLPRWRAAQSDRGETDETGRFQAQSEIFHVVLLVRRQGRSQKRQDLRFPDLFAARFRLVRGLGSRASSRFSSAAMRTCSSSRSVLLPSDEAGSGADPDVDPDLDPGAASDPAVSLCDAPVFVIPVFVATDGHPGMPDVIPVGRFCQNFAIAVASSGSVAA